jgi:hypothetical protein
VLLAAGAAPAQSLGDAARRERERRARGRQSGVQTFTDDDLRSRRPKDAPATDASPAPSPSPTPAPAGSEDEGARRRRLEQEWRSRFTAARANVARAEAGAWRRVIETDYVHGIPVQQWVRKFEETAELRQARGALADLEEEFRRTGLPAGWARE